MSATTSSPVDGVAVARQAVINRLAELGSVYAGETAIEFEDRTWTWGEVGVLAQDLHRILNDYRYPATIPVAVVLRQRPEVLSAQLGILAGGRSATSISPLAGDDTLRHEIEATAPSAVIAQTADWTRTGFESACRRCGTLGLEVASDGHISVRTNGLIPPDRQMPMPGSAVTVLTSGTTGPAKRLPVSWPTFVEMAGGVQGRPCRSGRGSLILATPLATLGGLLSTARLVFGGRPLAMMERFDVRQWAELVRRHRPRIIGAPPPVVQMILDADIPADCFRGAEAYMTSSAPIPPETMNAFEARYGIPVLLGYGATEFLSSVTQWTLDLWRQYGRAKLGSVGRASPGVRLRIVEENSGAEIPTGQEGILEVDSPRRADGLPPGWLRTNDRARIDEDDFLWIVGRADDIIIRGGFKVDLTQIESALRSHPAVSDALAVALPDLRLGRVPAAMVVLCPTEPRNEPDETDVIEFVKQMLPPYAVPVRVRRVDAIPRTSTMKASRAIAAETLAQD